MMMPENIELRIKDMTTLSDCIEDVKVCLNLSTFITSFMNDHIDSGPLRTHHTCSSAFPFSYEEKLRQLLTRRTDRVDKDKDHQF